MTIKSRDGKTFTISKENYLDAVELGRDGKWTVEVYARDGETVLAHVGSYDTHSDARSELTDITIADFKKEKSYEVNELEVFEERGAD